MFKSTSTYVISVSVIAIVLVLMVGFRLIPVDIGVRLGFFKSFTQESPKTPTLTKQITISPSSYETTYHNVTVTISGDEYVIKIDSLAPPELPELYNATGGCVNYTCSYCPIQAHGSEFMAIQNNTHAELQVVNIATIWNYTEVLKGVEKRGVFIHVKAVRGEVVEYYVLGYTNKHADFNLSISTLLVPLNEEAYNYSITLIDYVPSREGGRLSLELVGVNSSVTLSRLYSVLGVVVQELSNVYQESGEFTLFEGYRVVEKALAELTEIVESKLAEYDKTILTSFAVITDNGNTIYGVLNCLSTIVSCLGTLASITSVMAACPLCVQVVTCLPACFHIFTIWWCLGCIAMGLAGCLACATLIFLPVTCYEAGRCIGLW